MDTAIITITKTTTTISTTTATATDNNKPKPQYISPKDVEPIFTSISELLLTIKKKKHIKIIQDYRESIRGVVRIMDKISIFFTKMLAVGIDKFKLEFIYHKTQSFIDETKDSFEEYSQAYQAVSDSLKDLDADILLKFNKILKILGFVIHILGSEMDLVKIVRTVAELGLKKDKKKIEEQLQNLVNIFDAEREMFDFIGHDLIIRMNNIQICTGVKEEYFVEPDLAKIIKDLVGWSNEVILKLKSAYKLDEKEQIGNYCLFQIEVPLHSFYSHQIYLDFELVCRDLDGSTASTTEELEKVVSLQKIKIDKAGLGVEQYIPITFSDWYFLSSPHMSHPNLPTFISPTSSPKFLRSIGRLSLASPLLRHQQQQQLSPPLSPPQSHNSTNNINSNSNNSSNSTDSILDSFFETKYSESSQLSQIGDLITVPPLNIPPLKSNSAGASSTSPLMGQWKMGSRKDSSKRKSFLRTSAELSQEIIDQVLCSQSSIINISTTSSSSSPTQLNNMIVNNEVATTSSSTTTTTSSTTSSSTSLISSSTIASLSNLFITDESVPPKWQRILYVFKNIGEQITSLWENYAHIYQLVSREHCFKMAINYEKKCIKKWGFRIQKMLNHIQTTEDLLMIDSGPPSSSFLQHQSNLYNFKPFKIQTIPIKMDAVYHAQPIFFENVLKFHLDRNPSDVWEDVGGNNNNGNNSNSNNNRQIDEYFTNSNNVFSNSKKFMMSITNYPGKHLFIFVHGLHGNSYDLRLFKNYFALHFPSALFLICSSIQENTHEDIEQMGEKISTEVYDFLMENTLSHISRISFICHSLGGIVVRSALTQPKLKAFLPKLHTFISLSSPHLGTKFYSGSIVTPALWVWQKFSNSVCLKQLLMQDAPNQTDCFLYKLSESRSLEYFQYVFLISSEQDGYVPYHSARIEIPKESLKDKQSMILRQMVLNILEPIRTKVHISNNHLERFTRINVMFDSHKGVDGVIGRSAHIRMLDQPWFMQISFVSSFVRAKYNKTASTSTATISTTTTTTATTATTNNTTTDSLQLLETKQVNYFNDKVQFYKTIKDGIDELKTKKGIRSINKSSLKFAIYKNIIDSYKDISNINNNIDISVIDNAFKDIHSKYPAFNHKGENALSAYDYYEIVCLAYPSISDYHFNIGKLFFKKAYDLDPLVLLSDSNHFCNKVNATIRYCREFGIVSEVCDLLKSRVDTKEIESSMFYSFYLGYFGYELSNNESDRDQVKLLGSLEHLSRALLISDPGLVSMKRFQLLDPETCVDLYQQDLELYGMSQDSIYIISLPTIANILYRVDRDNELIQPLESTVSKISNYTDGLEPIVKDSQQERINNVDFGESFTELKLTYQFAFGQYSKMLEEFTRIENDPKSTLKSKQLVMEFKLKVAFFLENLYPVDKLLEFSRNILEFNPNDEYSLLTIGVFSTANVKNDQYLVKYQEVSKGPYDLLSILKALNSNGKYDRTYFILDRILSSSINLKEEPENRNESTVKQNLLAQTWIFENDTAQPNEKYSLFLLKSIIDNYEYHPHNTVLPVKLIIKIINSLKYTNKQDYFHNFSTPKLLTSELSGKLFNLGYEKESIQLYNLAKTMTTSEKIMSLEILQTYKNLYQVSINLIKHHGQNNQILSNHLESSVQNAFKTIDEYSTTKNFTNKDLRDGIKTFDLLELELIDLKHQKQQPQDKELLSYYIDGIHYGKLVLYNLMHL
eukprot:gene952-1207_t